jgi:L-ascorbate metabolism protein UlaG (beta-lactamase superfamily)
MIRHLAALVVILLVAAAAPSADVKKVTLRWHGQSFFDLESSKGTRIVFDPHAIEAYGRMEVKADLVLISHLHTDHTQLDSVPNKDKKVIIGLKQNGRHLDWNSVDARFRDVHIRSVGVYHDDVQGLERGKNTVFIVEVDGLRIVHLGDLGHLLSDAQVKAIGPVDVLLIPVGGVYTLNGIDAKKVVAQLKPRKHIVPMHYGTAVYDDLLPVNEFLDEQPRDTIRRFPTTNKLVIESDFKPDKPIIAVLNWK